MKVDIEILEKKKKKFIYGNGSKFLRKTNETRFTKESAVQ
jgi:hypothetical protein